MTILVAFDTVFDQCSVAVLKDNHCLYSHTLKEGRGQTQQILPMLDTALADTKLCVQEVKVWAFNQGPGAFSGIRINTAAVQALALATDGVCVGVSSLYALARLAYVQSNSQQGDTIASVMDARQNEVYACFYVVGRNGLMPDDERLLPYGHTIRADIAVGDGANLVCHHKNTARLLTVEPSAADIGTIAMEHYLRQGGVPPERALPVYLRHNAWKTLAEQNATKTAKSTH